jgi:hypothetical protein
MKRPIKIIPIINLRQKIKTSRLFSILSNVVFYGLAL